MSFVSLLVGAVFVMNPSLSLPVVGVDHPTAQIGQGILVGRTVGGISSFKGVAYAAPPVGELRWRPPQPALGWTGPRSADHVGAICIQPPANGDPGVGPLPMGEDCLTLNIWTPEKRAGPLPVIFWIHGGAYLNGSGTAALYDGTNLARRGVVVVTINYRLGRFGFFDHPALAAERPVEEPGGNYGLMDMIAALTWVHDHISAFGGDPAQVTLMGESAGGVAVSQLMVAPAARDLFARAVIQSGLGRQKGAPLPDGTEHFTSTQTRGANWAEAAGVASTASDLRAVPAEQLLSPAPDFFGGDLIITDGRIMSAEVEAAFARGDQAPVPLIIGTNSAEFWWMKPSDLAGFKALDRVVTDNTRDGLTVAYGGRDNYEAHLVSDVVFNEPARHLARLHSQAGNPTWLYRFDVVSATMTEPHEGATHASERPYMFDNLTSSSWPTDEMDQRAATLMADYWTGFVWRGDPNGEGRLTWPGIHQSPDHLLEFGNEGAAVRPVPFADRLDVIQALYDKAAGPD